MKKIIRKVRDGIMQITTLDERWYAVERIDPKTGLPATPSYFPSSSWICSYYPKGVEFYKWLASKGWDESQAIKEEAGIRGDKIHMGVDMLLHGETIKIDDLFPNRERDNMMEEIAVDEYEALMSFVDFYNGVGLLPLVNEVTIVSERYKYAGTLDFGGFLGKKTLQEFIDDNDPFYILDWKSGQNIWKSYDMQISSYKQGLIESVSAFPSLAPIAESLVSGTREIKMGIVRLGYKRNQKGYLMTPVEDRFKLFLATREVWRAENGDLKPKQRDYPLSISLGLEGAEIKRDPVEGLAKVTEEVLAKSVASRLLKTKPVGITVAKKPKEPTPPVEEEMIPIEDIPFGMPEIDNKK